MGLPDRTAYSVVTTMLSHQQILHFRTFGYVVLRGLLSPAEAATLHQEVTGALADAFGKIATEPDDLGGISGDYLPCAQGGTPRLSWTIDYLPCPGPAWAARTRWRSSATSSGTASSSTMRTTTGTAGQSGGDWVIGAAQIPSRAIALERLELLGVLAGQDDGRSARR